MWVLSFKLIIATMQSGAHHQEIEELQSLEIDINTQTQNIASAIAKETVLLNIICFYTFECLTNIPLWCFISLKSLHSREAFCYCTQQCYLFYVFLK